MAVNLDWGEFKYWPPAMKRAWVLALGPIPIFDEDGNRVGESEGILSREQVAELLNAPGGEK